MKFTSRINLAWGATSELGLAPLLRFALYQLGLRSGHYRRLTSRPDSQSPGEFCSFLALPDPASLLQVMGQAGRQQTLSEAQEILSGHFRLFGGPAVPLQLSLPGKLAHWTCYETGQAHPDREDIKEIWEPARFDWAYTLARAYRISGDERFPAAFWDGFETFQAANPPYLGPNWASAQEVALRLIAFAFSLLAFSASPHITPQRRASLAQALADHAQRIPPTLVYARAQQNNHLLSEAAGLYTAGLCLPKHPQAARWRALGWKIFNHALQLQIDPYGAYIQHSANYQRLALQLSLWFTCLAGANGQELPVNSRQRLASAVRWMLAMTDPANGQVPNLGPNDGARIQPLSPTPFQDYRPVLQAAAQAFLGERPFPAGVWDEVALWLPITPPQPLAAAPAENLPATPHILRSPDGSAWAYLRAARFHSRPGHADQLHLDLWRHGENLAADPGAYSYNAPPPWDNPLAHSAVHNTLTVNGLEQMRRAGRFLYLDWAQAKIIAGQPNSDRSWRQLTAQHNGYHRLGLIHRRQVSALQNGDWQVEDQLLPWSAPGPVAHFSIRLHWLLPDWPWELDGTCLLLHAPQGPVQLNLSAGPGVLPGSLEIGLARAGERMAGNAPVHPTWGWISPTYLLKNPALSYSLTASATIPASFLTIWHFPLK
jgi:hypothetical protein